MEEVLKYFPELLKNKIKKSNLEQVEEIRIRANKPVILKSKAKEEIINYPITVENILQILQKICDNSIYSYQNQICDGFITLKGGHRVGITGNAVIKDGKVVNLNYINSLNFRVARQILNCSNTAIPFIINSYHNQIYTLLLP